MISTKSRLLTRFPGAKKRISMDFSARRRDFGADDGTQEERDEDFGLVGLVEFGGEGEVEEFARGMEGVAEEVGERGDGDGFFVAGDGQATLGDVEDAVGGAAVVFGLWQMPFLRR